MSASLGQSSSKSEVFVVADQNCQFPVPIPVHAISTWKGLFPSPTFLPGTLVILIDSTQTLAPREAAGIGPGWAVL